MFRCGIVSAYVPDCVALVAVVVACNNTFNVCLFHLSHYYKTFEYIISNLIYAVNIYRVVIKVVNDDIFSERWL